MGWFTTADTEEFLAVAGEYLRAEPARNSVVLTVTKGGQPGGAGRRRPRSGALHRPGHPHE
jgi:hypothetical protein